MTTPDDYQARRRQQALDYARDESRRALNAIVAAIAAEPNPHRKARLSHIRDALALVLSELRCVT